MPGRPTAKLLVLGGFSTGKTHYGAQLLLRLNRGKSGLIMRGAAVNLEPFRAAIDCLNEGRAAPHTATTTYEDSIWPIEDRDGQATDLVWPDYGGEQIRDILALRRISLAWRDRIVQSAGWLFFIRFRQLELKDDIFSRPLASIHKYLASEKDFRISDQAQLIELLQFLLFMRGAGTLSRLSSPALMVLISCWDELYGIEGGSPPNEVFRKYLPLLADFVAANWCPTRLSVLGLSSLEKGLEETSQDQDFKRLGPEHFGYIINADGTRDRDLTIPVSHVAMQATQP